jgi:hypothetical protein
MQRSIREIPSVCDMNYNRGVGPRGRMRSCGSRKLPVPTGSCQFDRDEVYINFCVDYRSQLIFKVITKAWDNWVIGKYSELFPITLEYDRVTRINTIFPILVLTDPSRYSGGLCQISALSGLTNSIRWRSAEYALFPLWFRKNLEIPPLYCEFSIWIHD